MTYENIKREVKKEIELRYTEKLNMLNSDEGLKTLELQYRKHYKNNAAQKFKKYFEARKDREIKQKFDHLDAVAISQDMANDLILTVEWKKSHMWGLNPRVSTNYGFVGSSIGGCGYDKRSTATAEALNEFKPILKKLYDAKEKLLSEALPLYQYGENKGKVMNVHDATRELIGYGSGYSIIPRFEGGVGVECHLKILKNIGFNAEWIVSASHTDVFRVSARQ